jgi:general secretion pathway protein D
LSLLAQLDEIASKRNVIARPNLLAIDGRESELFVGDVVRYVKSIQATQNGVTVIVDEERVGVRLAVFPRVGADGEISLDMRPVLSYLRGFTPVPGGGQIPQTSERMTQATTVIKSGETVALGGLILDQDRKDVRGIPFLKDLPIIGQLFRRTDNGKQRTEVVFFLTAKEVSADNRGDAARPKG